MRDWKSRHLVETPHTSEARLTTKDQQRRQEKNKFSRSPPKATLYRSSRYSYSPSIPAIFRISSEETKIQAVNVFFRAQGTDEKDLYNTLSVAVLASLT